MAGPSVLDFWQWSASDLLGNTLRGLVAEYLVASALGGADGVRIEWESHDVTTPSGIKVEVKSAAHVQSWAQQATSRIRFGIPETRAWDAATSRYCAEARRSADVYVFALLDERDGSRVDPLDLDQWRFLVLPTRKLDAAVGKQKTIGLSLLIGLGPVEARYADLAEAVATAVREV